MKDVLRPIDEAKRIYKIYIDLGFNPEFAKKLSLITVNECYYVELRWIGKFEKAHQLFWMQVKTLIESL